MCGCDLPTQRNGTILRKTRRQHNEGTKHIANVNMQEERRRVARMEDLKLRISHMQLQRELERERMHVLLLAIVKNKVCENFGGLDELRLSATLQSEMTLQKLGDAALQRTLLTHTTNHIVSCVLREAARQHYELLGLIADQIALYI